MCIEPIRLAHAVHGQSTIHEQGNSNVDRNAYMQSGPNSVMFRAYYVSMALRMVPLEKWMSLHFGTVQRDMSGSSFGLQKRRRVATVPTPLWAPEKITPTVPLPYANEVPGPPETWRVEFTPGLPYHCLEFGLPRCLHSSLMALPLVWQKFNRLCTLLLARL